ncbi:MAG: hypothetical protein HUJ16_05965 [Kangiella sp.]|nr:hypothetical protein [Kangiella sp.]
MEGKKLAKVKKLFVENYYRKFLESQKNRIQSNYPDFWKQLNEQEALEWIDSVVIDAKKLDFGNEFLIEGYLDIVCKIGKDFITNPAVEDNIVKFISDSNFSPYVRVRDTNRYIDRNSSKLTYPVPSDFKENK